jgi:hypothetical protein
MRNFYETLTLSGPQWAGRPQVDAWAGRAVGQRAELTTGHAARAEGQQHSRATQAGGQSAARKRRTKM